MKLFRPAYSDIFKISAPISFSLLVPQISFIVNTLFVASLGTTALSVIGLASVYYLLLTWMGYGLNNALLMFLSQSSGARDQKGFKAFFQSGIVLAALFIIIMSLYTYFGFIGTYNYFIEDKTLLSECYTFLSYRMIGFPFLIFNQLINVVFISMGKTMKLLWGSIVGNAVNIALDYILIFGHLGFVAWGVHGAAFGSALGEVAYFLVMLSFFFTAQVLASLQLLKNFVINISSIIKILKASGPLIFQYIFSIGGWQFFFILMEKKGQDYVAATHILRNALGLIGVGAWALASTSNTMMGNFIGQQKNQYIVQGIKKLMIVGGIFGAVVSIILYYFRFSLIDFYTEDVPVKDLVLTGLKVIYFSSIIMCMSTVAFNAVIGVGQTRKSMIFEVSSVILYCLYLYVIVDVLNLDYYWSWTSDYVYWTALIIMSGIYMLLFVKKQSTSSI